MTTNLCDIQSGQRVIIFGQKRRRKKKIQKNPKKMKKMKNFLIFFFVYKTEKKLKRDCLQTSPG